MAAPPITERHLPHFHRRAPFLEKCRAATTANITISTALNNGDTLDGVTLATGDRVLVKDQTSGAENGIYEVGVSPARAYDVSTDDPNYGWLVKVTAGTTNAGTVWENTNTSAITVGSTVLTFSQVTAGSSSSAGGGFDVTPPHSVPMPAWVKPTGSGQITADAQGRLSLNTGANYKSFPGATYLEGCLYAIYREGTAHNSGASSIKLQRSYDLGRTWASASTVLSVAGTDDLRDPNIVALASGRLLLTYDTRNPYTGTDIHAYSGYSDDRGQTWTTGVVVADSFSGSSIVTAQAVELPSGTILLPGYGDNGGQRIAVVWKSTDGGLTFGSQVTIATGSHDWEEPVIRLLASGKLVALIRDTAGSVTYRSVSADFGATWGAASSVLTSGGRPDFVEFYPGALSLFLRGNNSTTTQGRYATSWDEGATWTALAEVDTGETREWEYSAPVLLAPGYVILIYSLETSSSDADLYVRYWHDGIGIGADGVAIGVGSGTVTSVALTMPAGFTVTGSPVTTSGTLAVTGGTPTDHVHIMNLWFSGDGATTVFTLPAGAFDSQSVRVWVSGTLTDVTLSGTILDTMTFGSAPASATNNIVVDLVAAAA